MSKCLSASIIICTCNRASDLRLTLAALSAVSVPAGMAAELIVVDNGSTDDTADVIARCRLPQMQVRYLYEGRRGKGYALNSGIAAAQGEVLVFTDDDVRPFPVWLENICLPITGGGADAVLGRIEIAPHLKRPWIKTAHRIMLASTDWIGPSTSFTMIGANMAVSRAVLTSIPSLDVELGPGAMGFAEETLFSYQMTEAGYQVKTAFDAPVEHHFDPTRLLRRNFLNQAVKQGRSEAYMAYHWFYRDIPDVRQQLLRQTLRLPYHRLRRRRDCAMPEGLPEWEIHIVQFKSFCRQFLIESRRPPNYDKRGLVKLRGRSSGS